MTKIIILSKLLLWPQFLFKMWFPLLLSFLNIIKEFIPISENCNERIYSKQFLMLSEDKFLAVINATREGWRIF